MISFLSLLHQLEPVNSVLLFFIGEQSLHVRLFCVLEFGRCFLPIEPAFLKRSISHFPWKAVGAPLAPVLLSLSLYTAEDRTMGAELGAHLLPWRLELSAGGWSRTVALISKAYKPRKSWKAFVFPSFWKENLKFFASLWVYGPERWACYEPDFLNCVEIDIFIILPSHTCTQFNGISFTRLYKNYQYMYPKLFFFIPNDSVPVK